MNKLLLLTLITSFFLVSSCRKNENAEPNIYHDMALAESEESNVRLATELAVEDAMDIFATKPGKDTVLRCAIKKMNMHKGAAPIKSILHLSYSGFNCMEKFQPEGDVDFELLSGASFGEEGACWKITYTDYKFSWNGNTENLITLNGFKYVRNIRGGTVLDLEKNDDALKFTYRGTFTIRSNDDLSVKTINIARASFVRRKLLDPLMNYKSKTIGDTTIDGIEHVASWGIDRKGKKFYNVIASPLIKMTCVDQTKIIKGVKLYKTEDRETTTTYGVDKDGTEAGNCSAYGKKISFINLNGKLKETVVAY